MPTPPLPLSPGAVTALLYAAVVAIWGTSWIAIRFQLGEVPPEVSVAYRFYVAAAVMVGFCLLTRRTMRFALGDHVRFAAVGLLLFSTNFYLVYLGAQYLATGLVSVVFSTLIVWNILNGALLFAMPVRGRVMGGGLVGIIGISLVFLPEIETFDLSDGGVRGLLLVLLGTLSASLGMLLSLRLVMSGRPLVQTNAWGMVYGGAAMTLFAILSGQPFAFAFTTSYVLSLLHLSILATVLGFAAYMTLQKRIGADRTAYTSVLFPILALSLSTWIEGYRWTEMAFAGVALVLLGNLIVMTRSGTFRTLAARIGGRSRD